MVNEESEVAERRFDTLRTWDSLEISILSTREKLLPVVTHFEPGPQLDHIRHS